MLEVLTIVGVVLSLIGIVATVITLLLFKWVSVQNHRNCFHAACILCFNCFQDKVGPRNKASFGLSFHQCKLLFHCTGGNFVKEMLQVPHPALHSSVLHANCFCCWYWQDGCVWRMCDSLSPDPLLYACCCDVDGCRSCADVPEVDHCVPSNHHPIHCCHLNYLPG